MELHLENYKSIINNTFSFSKVNIFIGENSAGKSSMMKFFILLKQSMIGFKNRASFNLAMKGEFFDFGSFSDLISFNDPSKKLIFEFEFPNYLDFYFEFLKENLVAIIDNYPEITKDFLNSMLDEKVKIKFEIDPKLKSHEGTIITIYNEKIGEITILSHVEETATFKQDICEINYYNTTTSKTYKAIEFEREAFFKFIKVESLQEAIKRTSKIEVENEVIKELLPLTYLLIAQNYIDNMLDRIEYLNPIHSNPKRYFMLEETGVSYSYDDLNYIVNTLNDDNLFSQEIKVKLINRLNEAIAFLGIADEIKFENAKNMPVVELKAKIKDFWSNITDVGYGLSLQLPILFRTILAGLIGDEKILMIEQPEVHLHPQLQAKFIETIIKFGGNSTFYIETHSEHIIRKLQTLVKDPQINLSSDDVSIYYFKREKSGSIITAHKIKEDGRLNQNFQSGFFDSSYLLAKELL